MSSWFDEWTYPAPTCAGAGCDSEDIEMRYDAYGLATRSYCDQCYESNYPYRKDAYYDYLNAGEHFDE